MNKNQKKAVMAAGGAGALGLGYLALTGTSAAEAAEQLPVDVPDGAVDTVDSWVPAYEGSEWGISENGVLYDDPETGEYNDEPGDDSNTSFETIEDETGGAIDAEETAENYAPDTEGDTEAPSSGVISDPGDSQVYGDAPEQENDDINDVGEMDDETASMFDRLANYDDPEELESNNTGQTSTDSDTSDYSPTSSTTSDDSDTSDDWETTYGSITIEEDNDAGYTAPEW